MNQTMKSLTNDLAAVDAERNGLTKKLISIVQPAGEQADSALATVAAIESKRRGLLGRRLLGESVDIDAAEAELARARETAAEHAQTAEAAQAARDLLQGQIDALNARAAQIRAQIEVEQWKAVYSAAGDKAKVYRKLCDDLVTAYLEMIGVAQMADSMRPVDSAPRCCNSVAPMEFQFPTQPLPELEGFQTYRRLHDQRARAEHAAREKFNELLEGAA